MNILSNISRRGFLKLSLGFSLLVSLPILSDDNNKKLLPKNKKRSQSQVVKLRFTNECGTFNIHHYNDFLCNLNNENACAELYDLGFESCRIVS